MGDDLHETCDETTTVDLLGPGRVHGCIRPAGHSGWHRDRSGASWIERMPSAGCYDDAALVAAYERGVAAGRRQAADALLQAADSTRETYVRDAFKLAARIAEAAPAEPVEEDTDGR